MWPLAIRASLDGRPILVLDVVAVIWAPISCTARVHAEILECASYVVLVGAEVAELVAVVWDFSVAPGRKFRGHVAVPGTADRSEEVGCFGFGLDHGHGEFRAFAPCFGPFSLEVHGARMDVTACKGYVGLDVRIVRAV
jgi:hypothetical protein